MMRLKCNHENNTHNKPGDDINETKDETQQKRMRTIDMQKPVVG